MTAPAPDSETVPRSETARKLTVSGFRVHAKGDFATAEEHYKLSLRRDPESTLAMNNLAWLRATCPDERFRDGEGAA